MERPKCGNCCVPLLDKTSKITSIVSSWSKQDHPQFVPVCEALSVLFEISPLVSNESEDEAAAAAKKKSLFSRNDKEDRWGLCNNCSEILTIAYNNFQEFTSLRRAGSEIAEVLKEVEKQRNRVADDDDGERRKDSRSRRSSETEENSVYVKPEPEDRPESDYEEDNFGYLDTPIKHPPVSPGPGTNDDDGDRFDGPPSPNGGSDEPDKENSKYEDLRPKRGRPRRNATITKNYAEYSSDSEDRQEAVQRESKRHFNSRNQQTPIPHQVTIVRSGGITIKQLKCPLCEKVFLHENVLICHRRIIHRENIKLAPPVPMPQLPFFQISKESREKALAESSGKNSTCPICRSEVPRTEIRNHLSKHTRSTSNPWMCTICGKECQNHEDLIQHGRSHQACVPCSRCGRRVSRLGMLAHLRNCSVPVSNFSKPKLQSWSCKLCKIKFTHRGKMLEHMESHKQKKAYTCKICLKTFNTMAVLRLHVKRFHRNNESGPPSVLSIGGNEHEPDEDPLLGPPSPAPPNDSTPATGASSFDLTPIIENRYMCKDCDYQCQETKEIESHLRTSHADIATLSCNICNRKLQDVYCLNLHLNSHAEIKPMECFICQKTYSQKNSFYFHLKDRHSMEARDIVYKYPQLFSFGKAHRSVRIRGQRISNATPKKGEFPCDVCGKVFPYIHSVRNHKKFVHEKVREYVCSYCGKSFPRRSYFLLHEKLHTTTETPYKCHLCSKGFRLPGNLRMHLQSTIHNPNKNFICDLCGKGFNRKDNLRLHVKAVHMKLPTRKPRSSGQRQMGKRRLYGAELEDGNNYVPNLPGTSTSSIAGISGTSHSFVSQRSVDQDSLEDTSSQISNESKVSHHLTESLIGHHSSQPSNLHVPVFAQPHAPTAGQNIVEAALQFAQQNEFPTIQQPQLGFNFRGSHYR